MKEKWTYRDLIDLEYLLAGDRDVYQADLHARDRQIFLGFAPEHQQADRSRLIHHWLVRRRNEEFSEGKSPGGLIVDTFRSFSILSAICGAFIGMLSGLTFFTYSGTTPVNVINFLFLFVFSQMLMLLFLVVGLGLRLAGWNILPAPIAGFYGKVVSWFTGRSRKLQKLMSSKGTNDLSRLEGVLKKQHAVHGTAFYWPLFSLSQRVMVCFNLGLLGATCFRILTSDIAFGWQSTIQFSTGFIARMTKSLASPWAWLVPQGYSYPSAAQIEGSRIILKDGIYHLQTQDLVSWWPFLLLCILFYGVIVRLILVMVGNIGQWQVLRRVKTGRPALVKLVNRMQTPIVRSQAAPSSPADGSPFTPAEDSTEGGPIKPASATLLLISNDIAAAYGLDTWGRHLASSGFSLLEAKMYSEERNALHSLLNDLRGESLPGEAGIMLVMESWMPPIKETLKFIKDIRASVGDQVPIFVGLVGQASDQHTLYRPSPVERKVWQGKLDALGDPYLSILDLGIQDSDAA